MFRTLGRALWSISPLSLCDLLFKNSILSYLRNLCNGRHSRTCQRLSPSSAELCCCSRACEEAQGDPPLHPVHSGHEASSWEVRCTVWETGKWVAPDLKGCCPLCFPGLSRATSPRNNCTISCSHLRVVGFFGIHVYLRRPSWFLVLIEGWGSGDDVKFESGGT